MSAVVTKSVGVAIIRSKVRVSGSGSQLWNCSLDLTFGTNTGVVPSEQNRARLF